MCNSPSLNPIEGRQIERQRAAPSRVSVNHLIKVEKFSD